VKGGVSEPIAPVPIGKAAVRRRGTDITLVGVGVGIHRAYEAAMILEREGFSAEVIDLRTVSPMDREAVCRSVSITGRLLVVDEDYKEFGLSGEAAASVLEARLPVKFGRVCTEETIPYSRELEDEVLPGTNRIVQRALGLLHSD
jgi:pyruvate dehydrogenase E1 component beta subunit